MSRTLVGMDALRLRAAGPITTVAAALVLLAGCSGGSTADPAPSGPSSSPTPTPTADPTEQSSGEPTEQPTEQPTERPAPAHPVSMAALARADLTGGDLRLGAVRERTPAYTSYDVTFASTTMGEGTEPLRISGVLNVPTGRGR